MNDVMAMKRLSSLVLGKWKEKERWTGRRRSEPYRGGQEEEEDTGGRMLKRDSGPCGQMDEENARETERQRSKTNMEEDGKKDRKRTEADRRTERRNSESWMIAEDRAGGQTDRRQREMDRRTMQPRSEPCGVLHVQLLPLSSRKRRELLQRRTGHRTSCSEVAKGRMDRKPGEGSGHMTRAKSEPISPLGNSKPLEHVSL